MVHIPRTDDLRLNALIHQVEAHAARRVKPSGFNRFHYGLKTMHLGVTELTYSRPQVWATRGVLTDDTLTNFRIPDRFVIAEVHVGTKEGAAVGFHQDYAPFDNGIATLETIVDKSCTEAFRCAAEEYGLWYGQSLVRRVFFPNLVPVPPVRHLEPIRERKVPTGKIYDLTKAASRILSEQGDDGRVRFQIHEETRRYVNSEGTIVRDTFYGCHLLYVVRTFDRQGRPMDFSQSQYFRDESKMKKESVVRLAEWIRDQVQKRKDCPVLETGLYPAMYLQSAMATELHECLVHLLASDEILAGSTVWGWENFGKQAAPRYLNVASDPAGRDWGSMTVDYEGVPAQRRELLRQGVVVGYLADRNGAYHLSRLTGKPIFPGDARLGITAATDVFKPQPRISNLDVRWSDPRRPHSRRELFQRFRRYLQRHGQMGVYFPAGSAAMSHMDNGQTSSFFQFPFIVPKGIVREEEMIPTKFVATHNYAHTFLGSILTLGDPSTYEAHRCGDDLEQSVARAAIRCGPGIVKDVHVVSYRPEERRQIGE